ncbi:chromatin assembly factor 1 subunit A-domain-containing protein [Xylaria palmicola]|nr:chromatin assembly factor 1 subunit A-domain-containing protein [Xylaria palmicola]
MPLSPVSPNVKASRVGAGKRPLDQFVVIATTDTVACATSTDAPGCENLSAHKSLTMSNSTVECQPALSNVPVIDVASSPLSSPPALDEADSSTHARDLASPNATPSKSLPSPQNTSTHSTQQPTPKPASKRKHKTTSEDKEKERTEKRLKQEEAAAEKARIAAAKEAKAKEKETVRAAKAEEKAKVDAVKEAKKQKKQEEELAAKIKKERQQNLMASFLKKAPATPSKTSEHSSTTVTADVAGPPASKQETEQTKSAYELNFKPFFVKPGVTVARPPFEMDDETKQVKSNILDEYIRGDRGTFTLKHPFNAAETFDFPFPQQRGIIPPSVKQIMETIHGDNFQNSFGIVNTKSESQTEKLLINAQGRLDAIPMKYIRFYEDVRPAYFGTITTPMTCRKLRQLSRRPAGKILPLAYDYDSEAEWVEDDGEDLDDIEDDEEDLDGDEEMDDFVDDSEAAPTILRPGFEADSLPISTGLCFENRKRLGPSNTVYKYRLEFLLDTLERHSMIDPFSTEYWPAPAKSAPARKPVATTAVLPRQGTITPMPPPPAVSRQSHAAAPSLDLKDGVPQDIIEDFKRALLSEECREYSKATVIEMLTKKFPSCTKAQVKVTLDTIAHRVKPADATKKSAKRWALLPGFSLARP